MSIDKFTRMARTLPDFYKAETNTMIRGLLKAWGVGDDQIELQIQAAKEAIFINTAEARFLDHLSNNLGVSRSPQLGIGDNDFRKLIPVLSFQPKQVRSTIINLLDVFWGPSFSRANLNAGNVEPYNFGPTSLLTGTVSFSNNQRTVVGVGTFFTLELQPGDYVKPTAVSGYQYAKVSQIIDDNTLELSLPWAGSFSLGVQVNKGITRELSYEVDNLVQKTIRLIPSAFDNLTAVTVSELTNFINNNSEHNRYLTASSFLDPILGSKLNLRTNTTGIQGALQILGGDGNAPSRLNFDLEKHAEVKVGVFEINPNEIVVQIPSSVPVLRRTLKGALHPKKTKTTIQSLVEPYNFSANPTSTLTLTVDSTPYTVTFTNASDFADPTKVTAQEVSDVINNQLLFLEAITGVDAFPKQVTLQTTDGSSMFQITSGTANVLLAFPTVLQQDPDLILSTFPSAYVFSPTTQSFTATGTSTTLTAPIVAGSISSTLTVANASSFPNLPGQFVLDFGRANQEGPIGYNSRPNNSTLLIDASRIFQFDHAIGRTINFVSPKPTIPRLTGDDYAVYIVGTEEARSAAQDLIKNLLASGVVIRFIIDFPEVQFSCVCQSCEPSNDPELRGSRTALPPLVF